MKRITSIHPILRVNARTYQLAMPKRYLGTLKNLKNFATPNTAKNTARKKGKAKGKENKVPAQARVLPFVRVFSNYILFKSSFYY
jgi:hypothetical protein